MRAQAVPVEFPSLLKPQYCPRGQGSSLLELKQAAEDHGMHAAILQRMTSDFLRTSKHPIILHTKKNSYSTTYDHYVLYLGSCEAGARIFDAPGDMQVVDFRDLSARWDGTGLVVSKSQLTLPRFPYPFAILAGSLVILAVAATIWLARRPSRSAPPPPSAPHPQVLKQGIRQSCTIVVLATSLALCFHVLADGGLLNAGEGVRSVQETQSATFLNRISPHKLQAMIADRAVTVVDARLPRSYTKAHIPGALSIPVNATDAEFRAKLSQLNDTMPIVVYCQSKDCIYDGVVAKRLLKAGYSRVCLLTGGWQDWHELASRSR
jgi:rhodanese-related sulfurtransferase